MYYYCFTIRKCSNVKTVKTLPLLFKVYDSYVKFIKNLHPSVHIEYHYEYTVPASGQYNLHLHSIIKSKIELYPKLKQKRGYSLKFEKAKNETAWNLYITKKPYTQKEITQLVTILLCYSPFGDSENSENLSESYAPALSVLEDTVIDSVSDESVEILE